MLSGYLNTKLTQECSSYGRRWRGEWLLHGNDAHNDQTSLTVYLKSPKGLKSVCCGFFSQPWNGFLHQPEKVMLLGVGFCTRRPVLWQHKPSMSWDETKKVSSNHTERNGIWNLRPGSNRSWLRICLRKSSHSLWLNFYIFLSLITGRVGKL